MIMSEGPAWELPVDVKQLTALYDVIHDVWKVKVRYHSCLSLGGESRLRVAVGDTDY